MSNLARPERRAIQTSLTENSSFPEIPLKLYSFMGGFLTAVTKETNQKYDLGSPNNCHLSPITRTQNYKNHSLN